MLRSDLCDFSDAHIVVKGNITLEGANAANKNNKNVTFRNNAPFINCISKINGSKTKINYKKTTGTLWNYYRDQPSNPVSTNSESFKYKTSITGNTYDVDLTIIGDGGNPIPNPDYDQNKESKKETEVVIPVKHLSSFWRTLDIPLINYEVEIILTSSKNCVLADMTTRNAGNNNIPPAIVAPSGCSTFNITDTKLYVPVVTLSKENDIKLLEKLKSGFKKTIKWNKYRSQMTIQPQNNNLNYLIDPTFTNVNRLFVLSFEKIEEDNVKKDYRD